MKSYLSKLGVLLFGAMFAVAACQDYDEDIRKVNDKLDGATAELTEITEELDAAIAALEEKHDADLAGVKKDLAEASAAAEAAITALDAAYKSADAALKNELMGEDAKLQQQIADAVKQATDALTALDAAYKAADAELAKAYKAADAAVKTEVLAYVDGKVAALQKSVDALAAADKALEEAYKAADTGLQNNIDAAIANAAAELATVKAELVAADATLEASINTLDERLKAAEQDIVDLQESLEAAKEELEAAIAEVQDNVDAEAEAREEADAALQESLEAAVAALTKAHEQDIKDVKDLIAANAAAIEKEAGLREAADNDLKAAYEAADAAEKKAREDADAALDTAIKAEAEARAAALKALKDELEAKINANAAAIVALQETAKQLEEKIGKVAADLEEFKKFVDETYATKKDLDELHQHVTDIKHDVANEFQGVLATIETLTAKLEGLSVNVEALMSRIQSLVYVPVFDENKAPINYVTIGDTAIETDETTVTYLVKPASAAKEIASAFAAGENLSLSYTLKNVEYFTKAMDMAKPELIVTRALGSEDGYLYLNVKPAFGQDFYLNEREKGISGALVVENTKYEATEEFTTEYVNFVPGEVSAAYDLGLEYTDGKRYDQQTEVKYLIKYTSDTVLNVLDNIIPVFVDETNPTMTLTIDEFEKIYGVSPWVGVKIGFDPEESDVFTTQFNDEEYPYSATVQLTKTGVLQNVGKTMNVTFDYHAGLNAELSAMARAVVEVVGELVNYNVADTLKAVWNYKDDAASDADELVPTYRKFEVALTDIPVDNILANTTLKDVLTSTPVLYVNDAVVTDGFVLSADDEKMTVEFTGFDWDMTYNVKAEYTLPYAKVYVHFTVETFDRNREPITVDYGKTVALFAKDLDIKQFGENNTFDLQAVVDSLVANGNLDADVAEDIFVNHETTVDNYSKYDAEGNVITSGTDPKTCDIRYKFDEMTFSYRYYATSFNVWYQSILYASTFTTWYGQEVTIEHTLEFELPTYDFAHRSYYVKKDTADVWYSQVTGKYTPELPTTALEAFEVNNIELDKAFYVVDPQGAEVADYAEFGLVTDFELEGTYGPGIVMSDDNVITYNDKDDKVDVLGKLFIKNSNGLMVELPTSFATEYADYYVNKYDPIGELHAENLTVEINNAKVYEIPVLSCFSLKDRRNFEEAYELIDAATGDWVVGDDNNGFSMGKTPNEIYGLKTNFSQVSLPAGYEQIISFQDGVLSFDNTNHMGIVEDINIDIVFVIEYTWGYREAAVTVTFPKNVK